MGEAKQKKFMLDINKVARIVLVSFELRVVTGNAVVFEPEVNDFATLKLIFSFSRSHSSQLSPFPPGWTSLTVHTYAQTSILRILQAHAHKQSLAQGMHLPRSLCSCNAAVFLRGWHCYCHCCWCPDHDCWPTRVFTLCAMRSDMEIWLMLLVMLKHIYMN